MIDARVIFEGMSARLASIFGKKTTINGAYFYNNTGSNTWKDCDPLKDFMELPEVNAVVNKKASMQSNCKLITVNSKGEEVYTKYSSLLLQPNWFQAQKEFLLQTKLYHEIYGNEYLYFLTPDSMPDNYKGIFTLPSNLVDVEYADTLPFFMYNERPNVKYTIVDESNSKKPLDSNAIVHYNDNRVNVKSATDKDMLKGVPKMYSLKAVNNNLRAAYESRGVILESRGALGILSPEKVEGINNFPLDPAEKEKVERYYSNGYGALKGQRNIIVTSANLKWQQMSVSPDKLGLFQETEEAFNKIIDTFGLETELFARGKGVTYENKKQAEKNVYINTIIPDMAEWVGGLNKKFYPNDTPGKESKEKIIAKYTHLDVFQEDLKFKAESAMTAVNALSKLWADQVITIDEYKTEIEKYGIKSESKKG